jgi:ArgP family transcriptional regulator
MMPAAQRPASRQGCVGDQQQRASGADRRQCGGVCRQQGSQAADAGGDQQRVKGSAVNADSLATWFPTALASVDPPVAFDVRRADETQTAALLRDGSVTAAVTAAAAPVPGCSVIPLGAMRYRPCASASFVEKWFAHGVTPAALANAPVIVFDRTDTIQDGTCAGVRAGA